MKNLKTTPGFWLELLRHRYAGVVLFIYSALESIILPVPVEALMVPLLLASPRRAVATVALATTGSIIGAAIAYGIGFAFSDLAVELAQNIGYAEQLDYVKAQLIENGWFAIVFTAITLVPFKIMTLTSGLVGYPFVLFLVLSFLSRGFRYALVGCVVVMFGRVSSRRHLLSLRTQFLLAIGLTLLFVAWKLLA